MGAVRGLLDLCNKAQTLRKRPVAHGSILRRCCSGCGVHKPVA
jgi:hypothetical protein